MKIKDFLKSIKFVIIIFFLIRIVGITNPPLEVEHNWRQCLTNMVARNFYEGSSNILYPTVDMAGEKTGIIGTEFPLFNYLIYLVSSIFSYSHWYGRLINLIISSLGIYFFYLLIEKLFNKKIAFNSAICLLASIWFAYSRKIMPDTFSISLTIIGLYFCNGYLAEGKLFKLLLFFLFTTLGVLCKLPALSLMSLLSVPLFIKRIPVKRKLSLIATAIAVFSIIMLWYFYWVPYLVKSYGYQLYFPKGIIEGIREISAFIPGLLEKFYFSSLKSYLAFACFLAGAVLIFRSRNYALISGVIVFFLIFLVFIAKTGSVFPQHGYYIIPFTPLMAFVAGYAIAKVPVKFQYIILAIIVIESLMNQQHEFFIKDSEKYFLSLENIANKTCDKNDRIIINGGPNPQQIYFTDRKGWTVDDSVLLVNAKIEDMKNRGAAYLFVNKKTFKTKFDKYPCVYKDPDFDVYKLK
jgi:hypothetical protein